MRLPAVGIVFLFLFSFLIDLYIAFDIKSLSKKKKWYITYIVSSILCWAFLIVTICLPRREEGSDLLTVIWMLYSYLSLYLAKLGYALTSGFGRILKLSLGLFPNSHPFKWAGIIIGCGLCGALWIGVGYTRRHIEVEKVNFDSPKVPSDFDGFRIVHISDLHVGTWGNDTSFISKLVTEVNSLHPDLIVFTGDLVNRQSKELEPFAGPLSRLNSKYGVLSILGNHDYGDYMDWKAPQDREINNQLLATHQKNMGWTLLNNRRLFIRNGKDSIMIVGVENWGDPPFPTYGDMEKALPSSRDSLYHQNDDNFKILLSHNPEHWNKEISHYTNIDLTLSGHTHAMQMVFRLGNWKWSPASFRYKQWGGMFDRKNVDNIVTHLYVNTGAGEVAMPARLFSAYPEITLITLHHKK